MSYSEAEIASIVRHFFGTGGTMSPEISPILKGGSQRTFYRVRLGNRDSVIFMHYDAERRENTYYAALAGFLREIGVSVPQIFHHDPEKSFLLMEDLGSEDLWHYRGASWDIRRDYYYKTLAMVGKLHAFRQKDFHPAEVPLMEAFSPALYRWEQDYFLQNFVDRVCHTELGLVEAKALRGELDYLVECMAKTTPSLIHRDLQSQNVMIRRGEPVLIDFQGMRYGNPFYDLGSLLYDPYVSFTETERDDLFDYYCRLSETYGTHDIRDAFRQASVQRLLQALGAYGFLGLKGNHPEFLAYIPAGLDNLLAALGNDLHLSLLRELALRCRKIIRKQP